MIKKLTPWWVVALSPLVLIPAGLLAPPAHADPVSNYVSQNAGVICDTIYARPLLSTIDAVVAAVMQDTGWDAYNAGRVVGQAVYSYCPESAAVVDRYVDVYAADAGYVA